MTLGAGNCHTNAQHDGDAEQQAIGRNPLLPYVKEWKHGWLLAGATRKLPLRAGSALETPAQHYLQEATRIPTIIEEHSSSGPEYRRRSRLIACIILPPFY